MTDEDIGAAAVVTTDDETALRSLRKKSYQTYVLIKLGEDWLIRSFQNTRVQPLSVWITRWAQSRANR
jgi:hypothetical protein